MLRVSVRQVNREISWLSHASGVIGVVEDVGLLGVTGESIGVAANSLLAFVDLRMSG